MALHSPMPPILLYACACNAMKEDWREKSPRSPCTAKEGRCSWWHGGSVGVVKGNCIPPPAPASNWIPIRAGLGTDWGRGREWKGRDADPFWIRSSSYNICSRQESHAHVQLCKFLASCCFCYCTSSFIMVSSLNQIRSNKQRDSTLIT